MDYVTGDDAEAYDRDGYLLVQDLLSKAEVSTLLEAVEHGQRVAELSRGMADASGKKSGIAIWHELGNDVWAAASTIPRIVNNVRILLREEPSFFHGKVMLKEPVSGGAWEWHQDYGYWYASEQYAYPRLLSAFVALDPATHENGCLQVLRGSHRLGRLDHSSVGGQQAADAERLARLEPLFERVECEMRPGSVLFFDCNLLHGSGPNRSTRPRRSFIVCFNALSNPRLIPGPEGTGVPCPVAAEDAILACRSRT